MKKRRFPQQKQRIKTMKIHWSLHASALFGKCTSAESCFNFQRLFDNRIRLAHTNSKKQPNGRSAVKDISVVVEQRPCTLSLYSAKQDEEEMRESRKQMQINHINAFGVLLYMHSTTYKSTWQRTRDRKSRRKKSRRTSASLALNESTRQQMATVDRNQLERDP